MRFALHTGAANMRRAEIITASLVIAGHEATQPWQDCYQVDHAAIDLADVVMVLLTPGLDVAEAVSVAINRNRPVLLWREPGAEATPVARSHHPVIFDQMTGDLSEPKQVALLVMQAAELARQHQAGVLERRPWGHGAGVLDKLRAWNG